MIIFENTKSGIYEFRDYGKKGYYTFPEGASINLDGVNLDISGIRVGCYGGRMDTETIKYFTQAFSKLPSNSRDIINSDISINDASICGAGYPMYREFEKNNIPFITMQDFITLQTRVTSLPINHSDSITFQKIARFIKLWTENSRLSFRQKLASIVDQDNVFPKRISIIYDDRVRQHATHIILEYLSRNECILHIDNTMSLIEIFENKRDQLKKDHNIDIETVNETFTSEKPTFVKLHYKDNPSNSVDIEIGMSISKLLLDSEYTRLVHELKNSLLIPIKKIEVNCSPLNQKLSDECVPFSLENKINFISKKTPEIDEALMDLAIRIRAEHALLAYLITGMKEIPHYSEANYAEVNMPPKPKEDWYPGFDSVCGEVNKRISKLPGEALEKLLLAMELDGFALSYSFKSLILESLKTKIELSEYISINSNEVDQAQAEEIESILAPSLFYHGCKEGFFIKKSLKDDFNQAELNKFLDKAVSNKI
jgi:hypothetical protein